MLQLSLLKTDIAAVAQPKCLYYLGDSAFNKAHEPHKSFGNRPCFNERGLAVVPANKCDRRSCQVKAELNQKSGLSDRSFSWAEA